MHLQTPWQSNIHRAFCMPMHASPKMCSKSPSLFSFSLCYLLLLQISNSLSLAADTISKGQFIKGNQTLVSARGTFELGFFTPGNSRNYYIGIWYKNIANQTVVWVANRETPVSDPSTHRLRLTRSGNLVIRSNTKVIVWSSNSTSSSSYSRDIVAVLLDTGNLVLRDRLNSSVIVWQSFDHPTDTRLPGGWVGMDKATGEYQSLISWKNSEDPAPGPFTATVDPSGADQFIIQWNNSITYYSTGLWNGQAFDGVPEMNQTTLFKYDFVDDDKHRYFTYTLSSDKILARNIIRPSGQVDLYMWFGDDKGWLLVWQQPVSPCDVHSVCGAFGICDPRGKTVCSCPLGFSPTSLRDWELDAWSSGCTRKTRLQCRYQNSTSGGKDGFLPVLNLRLPEDPQPLMVASAEECEKVCLRSCLCTAYAYESGCSIWKRNIQNLQRLPDGDKGAGTLYLRLAASDLPQPISAKNSNTKVIVIAAVGSVVLMILVLMLTMYRRRQKTSGSNEGPLVSFTYSGLQRISQNFSEMLGSGGFGSVFKGVLPDSTMVAVKRLEGVRQGEKQFRAELATLGTIQHVNLVCLRGFCCDGTNRLLVYDYMPNGSLDKHLFQEQSNSLEWKTRYQIIQGVARGLAYLHEECRECIIHCDIKPENVLLDSKYCAKLSDFGMAKLLGHDFSRVLTTIRGTIGYLAPEWISGLPITCKADVYSFGMMLFEVVSGRRNSEMTKNGAFSFFPVQAATKVLNGEVLSLLDKNLEGNADILELTRVCRVACWCIQDSEADRPSMGEIIKILEGILDQEMPPFPETLQNLAEEDPVSP